MRHRTAIHHRSGYPVLLLALLSAPARAADPSLSDFGIASRALPAVTALGATTPTALTGSERIVWTNRPIPVILPVGVERQIVFPAGVKIGLSREVLDKLRTQSVDGTVNWLAARPFEPCRVQVREVVTGRTYLLDVSAVAEGGSARPLEIVDGASANATAPWLPTPTSNGEPPLDEETAPRPNKHTTVNGTAVENHPDGAMTLRRTLSDNDVADEGPTTYDYVALTRYAAQQLYAPSRLLPKLVLAGVSRVPVPRSSPDLYRGGALKTEPYVAWTDGRHYVTAVRLSNTTGSRVVIDPRDFRGQWLARTLLYGALEPRGDPYQRDVGVVFLISPQPFQQSLR